ncbi:hypothetical protein OPU71_18495 [Niveibacterium sp. 24ML]|uniref:hypothetical protein n=1 Tax=Niveibacterium sp. 24ML TaxID=2985512 RepID=UPI00226F7715|nr:hypothetical protein [Niveibacterium sp. 24ML]MCX9158116.1 hypothetical protein [Niveibacterium sp. 24ML]
MTHNVVAIGSHPKLAPAGTEMIHEELGWVAVLMARGNERLVRSFAIEDDPEPELLPGEEPEAVLCAYRITPHDVWVCVSSLRAVRDPERSRPERLRPTYRHGSMFRLSALQFEYSIETPEQAQRRKRLSAADTRARNFVVGRDAR